MIKSFFCPKSLFILKRSNLISYKFSSPSNQVERQFIQPIKSKFQIIQKQKINHDCYLYKFKFDGPKFSLKVGQHFRIIKNIPTEDFPKGQQIMKYYTPISSCNDFINDKIELLLKIYRPNQNALYPKGGQLTPHLQRLQIGDKIDIQGPFSKFSYESNGLISTSKTLFSKTRNISKISRIFFIAGGTGITPIYQTLSQICCNPNDKTQLILLFCNKSPKDIILNKQLQLLKNRVKIYYMVDQAENQWQGLTGRVTKEVLQSICQLDDRQTFYLSCGPKMMNIAVGKIFQNHFPQSKYFKI